MTEPTGVVERLAALWPRSVADDPALDRALDRLETTTAARTVGAAARVLGATLVLAAVGIVGGLIAAGVDPTLAGVVLGGVTLIGACLPAATARTIRFRATMRRTRALGAAAGLIGRAALRLRIEPTIEGAAAFAADTGHGPLSRSLDGHVARAVSSPHSGLTEFAHEWSDRFPALERATARLDAAASAPAAERDRHLDRAVEASLDGVREELADFTADIRGPVTGLYAFGVLLPLALVGVLPAARATGIRISLVAVVLLYDVLLPLCVVTAGVRILARRPIAFPPPPIDTGHPDTPDGVARGVVVGLVGATVGAAVVTRAVGPWAAAVVAAGVGPGIGLTVHFRAAKRVRERVDAVETDLHDALYLVGRRVANGEAVETAIDDAAERVAGMAGDLLADAAVRQRRLNATVAGAFHGDGGVLTALPSRRAAEMAALFDLAATEGRPAGDALIARAEHVAELRRVEREARRELARITDTLANTATVFGPLVGGTTVALSARVTRTGTTAGFGAGTLPTAELGVAIGAYVLWLSVVLTVIATGLTRGLDRSIVGYRAGVALCLASTCYIVSYVGSGLFL